MRQHYTVIYHDKIRDIEIQKSIVARNHKRAIKKAAKLDIPRHYEYLGTFWDYDRNQTNGSALHAH